MEILPAGAALPAQTALVAGAVVFVLSYLVGAIPWAYIIVKLVTGEDITTHGSGNVGAMNVRRTTDSWFWFAVDVLADGLKGILPVVAAASLFALLWARGAGVPAAAALAFVPRLLGRLHVLGPLPGVAMIGAVVGHNWSVWMSLIERRLAPSGKGLATGGGALLVYDWRLLVAGLVIGLGLIALTRYSMAGQVGASIGVPLYALAAGYADWPYAAVLGAVVYVRHHKRFVGMLRGEEPKLYIHDRQGPRG